MPISLEKVADNIQEVRSSLQETSIQAAEQRDKEGRRNNLIIYKIPESNEPRAEDRNKADVSYCLQLFNNSYCLHAGITEEDLVHVFPLGRRDDSNNPRPLMIQLARYSSKNLIMESLYKLKKMLSRNSKVLLSVMTWHSKKEMNVKIWSLRQKDFQLTIPRGNTHTGYEVSRGRWK